jgi:3-dehydroquinate synthase
MVSEVKLSDYTITVERGLMSTIGERVRKAAPAHRYAVITDSNVEPLYGDKVLKTFGNTQVDLITIPAGESHKTRETWAEVTDRLITTGFGRDTTIVALGGGVVGDLAGFVAATFMRGVPFVQVPTTLLSMIDASVGGKTGVDTPAGKNLVGSFHQPAAVLADPQVLATLAFNELRGGFAEAIKHGVIADALYFGNIEKALPKLISVDGVKSNDMLSLITRSIEIKADIVSQDEREHGLRKILNFGHTVGHAVELLSGYTLLHGEAIAIGMVVESRIAEQSGIAEAGTSQRIRDLLVKAELPTELPESMGAEEITVAMRTDKKAREGEVEYALPKRIGEMARSKKGHYSHSIRNSFN